MLMKAWRRSPFFHFDVAVVSIVAVLIIGFSLASAGGGVADPPSRPATAVTVDPGARDPVMPQGFLGLSIEYPALEAYAGSDPSSLDPVFQQLVRNLAPGQEPVLRIGGNSADRTWWPVKGVSPPPGVTFDLTRQWLAVTRALAQKLEAHLILGVNLEQDSPQLAGAEARALVNGVGTQSVRALELGNEPDLYSAFPCVPIAGPSLSGMMWSRDLGQFLAGEPHLGLVTLHRYPLQVCLTPRTSARYPTISRLLSAATSTDLARSFVPYVALARAHGLSLRVDELNTVSCGADPAVSKSFASALWALNTLFGLASAGVSGVNVHTFPGAGYELFKITDAGGQWRAAVSPEYYGMLMFADATPPGSHLLSVSPTGIAGVDVWATRATDGTVRVVLTNEGTGAHDVSVHMPGKFKGATVTRLTAPSASATSGVTLGGQSFGAQTSTGRLAGRTESAPVATDDGRYVVSVPAASAAMLELSPH
jgi:hypothetical protein